MKRSFPFLFAIFLALVLCCPALGAQEPAAVLVSAGGVPYRLIIPKGYRLAPKNSPEYLAHIGAQHALKSDSVLAMFTHGRTRRLKTASSARPKFRNVITFAPGENAEITKSGFAAVKKQWLGAAAPEVLRREMERAGQEQGVPVGDVANLTIHPTPAEYIVLSAYYISPGARENNMGAALVMTAVDGRLMSFGFYDSGVTPDTLDDLAKEAEAYARQYVDAGWVAFAPERVQSAPSARERIGEDIIQYVTLLGVLAGILGLLHLLRPQPTTPPKKTLSWNERRDFRRKARRSPTGNG